jgi:inosine-uridine nucleoside N-ribohydrolase
MAVCTFLICLMAQAVAETTCTDGAQDRKPVIIIADVGIDDAGALLLALASPELEILGVVSSFGGHDNVSITHRNAQLLLSQANRTDIPVFLGPPKVLTSTDHPILGASIVHGADGIGCTASDEYWRQRGEANSPLDSSTFVENCVEAGGAMLPPLAQQAQVVSGTEFIVSSARARPSEITVLCFSPMTALAAALMLEPALPRLLRRWHEVDSIPRRRKRQQPAQLLVSRFA